MSVVEPTKAWSDFVRLFYSPPNELAVTDRGTSGRFITWAQEAWLRTPSSPFFLPVRASGWTYWYAICPDGEQFVWVRELIQAYIGSWATFSGQQPIPVDSTMPLDQAVMSLVGPGGCAIRLLVPKNINAETSVLQGVTRLIRSLTARPYRHIHLARSLGRIISDFSDACTAGAEAIAEEFLALLLQDHRLSGTNKLFLRLQFLGAFSRWAELEESGYLPDLIRIDRPALASDVLARLFMARLSITANVREFERSASKFGCLVGSITMIRSAAGAQYYAYWAISCGESPAVVAVRLLDAGWLDLARRHGGVASLLPLPSGSESSPMVSVGLADLQQAIDGGRLDTAIYTLAQMPPSPDMLPVVIDLVTRTLSPQSIELLQQWRVHLGESAVQDALSGQTRFSRDLAIASERFTVAFRAAFARNVPSVERAQTFAELQDQAVSRLMEPGVLREFVDVIGPLSRSTSPELLPDLIDLLLDIERDLFSSAGDVAGMQQLRLIIFECWALGDESGDRHRANRLLDLLGRTLSSGVSPEVFDELVESLRAGWAPFLTNADLSLSLEVVEILSASQPETAVALHAFAALILSRIGPHNARQIDAAQLETARMIAQDFGLELSTPEASEAAVANCFSQTRPPVGTSVAIYSLMEPAAARAASIVQQWYPEVRVDTFAEKVASDALRHSAKRVDLLVIADKAAAHAATDALKAARGNRPIVYARGKGTASLVEAVIAGFDEIYGEAPSATSVQRGGR
jgi:hypothetical protein